MAESSDHPIQPYSEILAVLLALLVLTGVTVGVSQIDLGVLNVWMAILIASVKSSLVLLYFMHLKHEGRFLKATFLVTVFALALLIGFLFWDVFFRAW